MLLTLISIIAVLFFVSTLTLVILLFKESKKNASLKERLRLENLQHEKEKSIRSEIENVQKERHQQEIKLLEERFNTLSEEVTKRRSQELLTSNQTAMTSIITPLKESLGKMEQQLKEHQEKNSHKTGILEKLIEQLMLRSDSIGQKADALAEAMRKNPKIQGDWGEAQLEILLERENFYKGIHYDIQTNIKGNQNSNLRPDVILHFPDERDVIIDAKVSLSAFIDYIETDDDPSKEIYARKLLNSIDKHIQELATKNYQDYIPAPRKALDYVIMFVPNDQALQLAYALKPSLWTEAMQKRVFVTSEQNLMVLLRLIRISWVQYAQTKNLQELATHAKNLVRRSESFIDAFETLQRKINDLDKAYHIANTKLRGGQGLLTSARKISELGDHPSDKLTAATPSDISLPEPTEEKGEENDARDKKKQQSFGSTK